jgi:hypothetical protein
MLDTVCVCVWGGGGLNKTHDIFMKTVDPSQNEVATLRSAKRKCGDLAHRKKLNSVALVHERTIPTEQPPPVGEVSANFCG